MRLKDGNAAAAAPARSLRGYLYDKYVYRSQAGAGNGAHDSLAAHAVVDASVSSDGLRTVQRVPVVS